MIIFLIFTLFPWNAHFMLAYIGLLSAIILLTVIGNTSALASPAFTNGACSQAAQMRREVPKAKLWHTAIGTRPMQC